MSDPAIDPIRRVNPIPEELPPPPIDEVLRRIDAGDGALPSLSRRGAGWSSVRRGDSQRFVAGRVSRGRRFTIGGMVTAVMSMSVLAIAVGLLLLLGGHRRSSPMPSTSGEFATRQQLVDTLGVLRAPPTPAARRAIACAKAVPDPRSRTFLACRFSAVPGFFLLPPAPRLSQRAGQLERDARLGYPRLDRFLLRVVVVPPLDASVTIAPTTWQPSTRSRRRSEGIVAELNYANGQSGTGPEPTDLVTVSTRGLWISDAQASPRMTTVRGAVLVPDGVAKVTLQPTRIVSPPAPITARHFGTITASVHDNVAAFRFPVLTATNARKTSALYGVTVIARATWFDQRGNLIHRTSIPLYLSITVRGQGAGGLATIP
jgi:hypothetical protein